MTTSRPGGERFRNVRTTERLVLRGWRPEDAAALAALNADAEVRRYVGAGVPLSRAESDAELTRIREHWTVHGFGLWCVAQRERPDRCLGFVGLAVPSFLPAVLPAVEVGWRLAREAWGRGLATEGARAATAEAFEVLGLESVLAIVDPRNARSLRVATKLGMRPGPERTHPVTGRRLSVLELSSEDAASSSGPS